ncbi:MAG: hypothetical protein K5648_02845 [Erysipelotrichaceae bacterium]|nr:hypothetical protein [Erysipelotrichaceae bacterium]
MMKRPQGKDLIKMVCIAMIVFVSLLSYAYAAKHVDHECEEGHCMICSSIGFALSGTEKRAVLSFVVHAAVCSLFLIRIFSSSGTPVVIRRRTLLYIRMNE